MGETFTAYSARQGRCCRGWRRVVAEAAAPAQGLLPLSGVATSGMLWSLVGLCDQSFK